MAKATQTARPAEGAPLPAPLPAAELPRASRLYSLARLQLPAINLREAEFRTHLARTYAVWAAKVPTANWGAYLNELYLVDWLVCVGCLTGQSSAWDLLFAARTGRSDCLLVDALRARAARLYPRNDERQENAVHEFWSLLIVAEGEGQRPVLARYDGQRPLTPWLIRVFQNWHVSKLRGNSHTVSLPDDDLAQPIPPREAAEARWHEVFNDAARAWLAHLHDAERLILGLRVRYKMSQREVANLLGVHEGTISRRTDSLRDRALESLTAALRNEGWPGDDLEGYILTELGAILLDDPGLSAEALRHMLGAKAAKLPGE